MGIYIERRPPRIIPQRRYRRYPIPGKSGEALKLLPGWENYMQPYEIAIVPLLSEHNLSLQIDKVTEWLLYPGGYQRLEDSYNPGVYRMAAVTNAVEVTNQLGKFGRAVLQMECLPERWLLDGDKWQTVDLTEGLSLANPTLYDAEPLISITATGSVGLVVNNYVNSRLTHHTGYILNIGTRSKTVRIDSEKKGDATYSDGTNANGIITVGGEAYPILYPTGVNTIGITDNGGELTGTVTALSIKPRWYIP